ncbi:hypothetical protein MICRO8M_90150 [Microbacterium sp. 8M]|nr:hypothetical protein MICRO8M_90150 [Microbacterium sp. 8M]
MRDQVLARSGAHGCPAPVAIGADHVALGDLLSDRRPGARRRGDRARDLEGLRELGEMIERR